MFIHRSPPARLDSVFPSTHRSRTGTTGECPHVPGILGVEAGSCFCQNREPVEGSITFVRPHAHEQGVDPLRVERWSGVANRSALHREQDIHDPTVGRIAGAGNESCGLESLQVQRHGRRRHAQVLREFPDHGWINVVELAKQSKLVPGDWFLSGASSPRTKTEEFSNTRERVNHEIDIRHTYMI